jgi:ribosomal protein S18 acetylase RimI-like enzyme
MHPLDRPIWNALTGPQANFAEVAGTARRFPPAVTTLGALETVDDAGYAALGSLQQPRELTALFLEDAPNPPAGWKVVRTLPLSQMVHQQSNGTAPGGQEPKRWVELGSADEAEMLALAQLTEPGPFGTRTRELGTFLGIRKEGKLVSMAGVRLHVPGFTEISAVCTHPDHTGHGYAAELMLEVMARVRQRGETPFLHVRGNNTRAIQIYERLGYKLRRTFHLALVQKQQNS